MEKLSSTGICTRGVGVGILVRSTRSYRASEFGSSTHIRHFISVVTPVAEDPGVPAQM